MPENPRLSISLSPYDLYRLKIWATIHGRSPAAYAAQIISARIESNFAEIEKQIESYAELHQISREDATFRLGGERPGHNVDTET